MSPVDYITFFEPDDVIVSCEEFTAIDEDQDEHYGYHLTIRDPVNGDEVAFLGTPRSVERLVARIVRVASHPKPEH